MKIKQDLGLLLICIFAHNSRFTINLVEYHRLLRLYWNFLSDRANEHCNMTNVHLKTWKTNHDLGLLLICIFAHDSWFIRNQVERHIPLCLFKNFLSHRANEHCNLAKIHMKMWKSKQGIGLLLICMFAHNVRFLGNQVEHHSLLHFYKKNLIR